jgi:hypothetical protein
MYLRIVVGALGIAVGMTLSAVFTLAILLVALILLLAWLVGKLID